MGKELQFVLLLSPYALQHLLCFYRLAERRRKRGSFSGRSRGGWPAPLLFLDQSKTFFGDSLPTPLSKGLDDRPPSPLSQGLDPALSFSQCFAPLHSLPSGVSCTSPAWLNETGKTATRITLLFRELKQQRRRRRRRRRRLRLRIRRLKK